MNSIRKDASICRLTVVVICALLIAPLMAHPPDEWHAQQVALASWADALASRDASALAAAAVPGLSWEAFSDTTQVVTRYANYSSNDEGVTASPVVILVDDGGFRIVVDVQLTETSGQWKIAAVTPSFNAMPEALVNRNLPEHVMLQEARINLRDSTTNEPVYGRVRIVDESGSYWPPDGHQKNIRTGWREDVGGDVQIAGKTWAYVAPSFGVKLPVGRYTIDVAKGTEYRPKTEKLVVTADLKNAKTISLNRWSDLNSEGWYAGDTHTHFLADQTGLLELRAEDLSVLYILATKWGELITDVQRFTGKPSVYSTPTEIVVYNEETRHGFLGHTILHGISELVYPLTWGGPGEGVIGGYDYPPMAHQADRAHELGGLVTWAHFPGPGGELAVDIALNKIDTVDLFTWGDAFGVGLTPPGSPPIPNTLETWYSFLNTNSRLPATAGTDKMLNVQVSGSVRTWAYVGDNFTYQGWLDSLKAGRTFVSTGPIVRLTANGSPIGSDLKLSSGSEVVLQASMEAPFDQYPIDQLEIVVGGKVLVRFPNDAKKSLIGGGAKIWPQTSTWVAARANGSKMLPYQVWPVLGATGIPPMAHTSPIYLTVDDQPVWSDEDAAILAARVERAVAWATNTGNYLTEEQRAEVIRLYRTALKVYQR